MSVVRYSMQYNLDTTCRGRESTTMDRDREGMSMFLKPLRRHYSQPHSYSQPRSYSLPLQRQRDRKIERYGYVLVVI